ncbi:MAG: glycosyltransferase [Nocardiopsaceae bacterium]|nr:glycosyltransferase [Nocardiopsaceae bacterium]
MHVVVGTVVHHPADARIYFRQIRALLDAGHRVTYIAPFGEPGAPQPGDLTAVTIPRAVGRRRLGALRAARAALRSHAPAADLLLVHDPELLLVLPPRATRPPTVWDVHEDTAAALTTKAWLPSWLRPAAAGGVRLAERLAERRLHLLLAEHGYNARFAGPHPVVPNTTFVPDEPAPASGPRRVVYLGHISPDRGSAELAELGRRLAPHGISVELIGSADAAARAHIEAARTPDGPASDGAASDGAASDGTGAVRWHGFVPNEQALTLIEGALAGLSLLHDEENFRHSMPTKVHEYMARGLPVITTPLPLAAGLVAEADCGFTVPFGADGVSAAADAIGRLDADPGLRAKLGARAHAHARACDDWRRDSAAFVAQLQQWAGSRG